MVGTAEVDEAPAKSRAKRGAVSAIYETKPATYYAAARMDMVALLTTGPDAAVLELGCGSGGTGKAIKAAGKAGRYVGIELSPEAGELASEVLDRVVIGNVEELDLQEFAGQFDALVFSEVLEHLIDPWTVLGRLVTCLKPGGVVIVGGPNVAHWQIVRDLILGRFRYQEAGPMDRTHLRWFTPESYRSMFEGAGLAVDALLPTNPRRGWKPKLINALTGGRLSHLFMTQVLVTGHRR